MKIAVTWGLLLTLLVACITVQWLPDPQEHTPRALDKVLLLKSFAWPIMFAIICGTPSWVLLSTWRVRKAIEKAQEPDYDGVQHWLRPIGAPLYPSPRYNDIVCLLQQLYTTPSAKPEVKASHFSQYFATAGQGYFLTLEGKLKMLDRVNSGFLPARLLDNYEPKDIGRIVRNLIVVAVLIKLGTSIIGPLANWFTGR